MPQFRAIVSGYVQGVSFRYYTVKEAKMIGLSGFVRNIPSNSVEVVAQGKKGDLLKLVEWLKHGPSSAHVERVEVEWLPESEKFNGFSAKH